MTAPKLPDNLADNSFRPKKYRRLSVKQKIAAVRSVEEGRQSISAISKRLGISRTIFYQWRIKYYVGKAEKIKDPKSSIHAHLSPKEKTFDPSLRHPLSLGTHFNQEITEIVKRAPSLSSHKLSKEVNLSEAGVRKILRRLNLSRYENRRGFQRAHLLFRPWLILTFFLEYLLGGFLLPEVPVFGLFLTLTPRAKKFRAFLFFFLLFATLSLIFYKLNRILFATYMTGGERMGLILSEVALLFGVFFFLYSLKYYITIVLVLFSSRSVNGKSITGGNGNGPTPGVRNGTATPGVSGNGYQNGFLNGKLNGFKNGFKNGFLNGIKNGNDLNGKVYPERSAGGIFKRFFRIGNGLNGKLNGHNGNGFLDGNFKNGSTPGVDPGIFRRFLRFGNGFNGKGTTGTTGTTGGNGYINGFRNGFKNGFKNGTPPSPNGYGGASGSGSYPPSSIQNLTSYPKVSIHLPFYNEKRVAERILEACRNLSYPNPPSPNGSGEAGFEVIVVDDSNDGTTDVIGRWGKSIGGRWKRLSPKGQDPEVWECEIQGVARYSKGGQGIAGGENGDPNPANPSSTLINPPQPSSTFTLKLIKRYSRLGFKGGALREALRHTDPKAEYIVVFDADFIPFPDTIEQFLSHFHYLCGGLQYVKKSRIAAIQGYQWHILNKDENRITQGVRTEYAGSYVVERAGTELTGALKQIAGSVYMIRRDILDQFGWGTSITEDFQLTLRLYAQGYKVIYTPYIQTPAEAPSTLRRLVRQRMRWAEGHTHQVKQKFAEVFFAPRLYFAEKLEFLYLSPYYLQAFFFAIGTLSWFIAEIIFKTPLPFWTQTFGWALVVTNLLSLPFMNAVGLFLEEAEKGDYKGIFSFIANTYILVPFQAYAALKGLIEKKEGYWFRTPKTGMITISVARAHFARLLRIFIPRRYRQDLHSEVSSLPSVSTRIDTDFSRISTDKGWAFLPIGVNPRVPPIRGNPRRRRFLGRLFLSALLITSILINLVPFVLPSRSFAAHVSHQESVVGSCDACTSVTTANLQGGTNQFYVLAANTENDSTVDSVSGGGLTWTFAKEQCGSRSHGNQTSIWVYYAFGSPTVAFGVTIAFNPIEDGTNTIVAIASRYSGVDPATPIEDTVGHNTLGENGACSGGLDGTAPELTTGSTLGNSIHYVATYTRSATITNADDYTERGTVVSGVSGGIRRIYVHDKKKATTGDDTANFTIDTARDWETNGFVIRAAAGPHIEQQVNIIDQVITAGGTDKGIIRIDTPNYTVPNYYFEVVAQVSSGSGTAVLTYNAGTGDVPTGGSTVTISDITATTYTRYRSSSTFTPTGEQNAYVSSLTGTGISVKAARIIIIQAPASGNSIADTQTQVEVGNVQSDFSNTAYATLTDHKIYLFDTNKFSGTKTVFFEATLHTDTAGNTVSAQLLRCNSASDCSGGTAVSGSEVTHTGDTNWVRKRSSDILTNLTDDANYAVQVKMSSGTGDIANAKIIIEQTDAGGLTDIELVHQYVNTLATDTDNVYTSQDYDNQFNPTNFSAGTFTYLFEATLKNSTAWYNTDWSFRKKITIQSSGVTGDLSNFPVLISITDADLSADAQADGGDILFTSSNGTTKLDHEIEKYTSGTGELVAWAEVPSLSSTQDTILYMYYGNATVADQWNITGTWDEGGSNNFKGVWHLDEDAAGTGNIDLYQDSTSNANHADDFVSATGKTGQIDGGQQFDGADDYAHAPTSASLDITGNQITIEAWVRLTSTFNSSSPNDMTIIDGGGKIEYWFDAGTGKVTFSLLTGTWFATLSTQASWTGGTWYHIVSVYNGANRYIYVNGPQDNTNADTGNLASTTFGIRISQDPPHTANEGTFNGEIDEVRISDVGRSADWVATSFNNQNSPGTFHSLGPEQTTPTAFAQLWNETDGSQVDERTTTNAAYTRVRSAGLTMPSSAKTLDTRLKNSAASGETTSASTSWLIIQVSSLQIPESLLFFLPLALLMPKLVPKLDRRLALLRPRLRKGAVRIFGKRG